LPPGRGQTDVSRRVTTCEVGEEGGKGGYPLPDARWPLRRVFVLTHHGGHLLGSTGRGRAWRVDGDGDESHALEQTRATNQQPLLQHALSTGGRKVFQAHAYAWNTHPSCTAGFCCAMEEYRWGTS